MDERLNLMKNYFSFNQSYEIYNHDYIEINLKNLILNSSIVGKFLPIKDLYIYPDALKYGWNWHNDLWLKQSSKDKLILGQSILKKGTYYPFIVSPIGNDNKLYVFAGTHRIISLKMLSAIKEIDENFKVFCLIFPEDYISYHQNSNNYNGFYIYRDILVQQDNFVEILGNQSKLNTIYEQEKKIGKRIVRDSVVEMYSNNCFDVLHAMDRFSNILRDLFWIYDDILPNKVINDEQEYNKWITQ